MSTHGHKQTKHTPQRLLRTHTLVVHLQDTMPQRPGTETIGKKSYINKNTLENNHSKMGLRARLY